MKKTLIAFLALGGMSMANDFTLTTGISVEYSDNTTKLLSALNSDSSDFADTATLSESGVVYKKDHWPGEEKDKESLSYEITIKDLYNADQLTESFTLNTFSYMVYNEWSQNEGRTVSLSVDGAEVSGRIQDLIKGNWVTLDTSSLVVTKDSVLTLTIHRGEGYNHGLSLALAGIKAGTGASSVSWSGVTSFAYNFTGDNNNPDTFTSTDIVAPLVKLGVTTAPSAPEPTTATLSLLALAGLAARRRRK